jgi:ferredoxin
MHAQDRIASISAQLNALAAGIWQLQAEVWEISSAPGPALGGAPGSIAQAGPLPSGLTVRGHLCLGCGLCARIAPRTFSLDPQTGKAKVGAQGGDPAGMIQMAMARCPAGAIQYGM